MHVMLIARFEGDVQELKEAYDRAHRLIMERAGGPPSGELRHHCAVGEGALYLIGVWESEETLTSVGFPSPKTADITVLQLHATEPPLR